MFRVEALLALSMVVGANAAEPTPHAVWQERGIKAFSPEQIEDYLEGRGMGMALPAELNGYPGPRHVLELAAELDLTAEQRAQTRRLFEDMRRGAIELGAQIVDREAILDEMFLSATVSEAMLRDTALALGRLSGELRAHHLGYHLAMRDLLDPRQIEEYQRLRGYAAGPPRGHGHQGHGGHDGIER
jgi:Spy/CpxP family protein refolding chaperone